MYLKADTCVSDKGGFIMKQQLGLKHLIAVTLAVVLFIGAVAIAADNNTISQEEIDAKFGFLVDAYHYAAPPHGGMGLGLDRLAMLICGADSLRDVVAFPKVQNASELMSNCPSPVDKESLDILGISVKE